MLIENSTNNIIDDFIDEIPSMEQINKEESENINNIDNNSNNNAELELEEENIKFKIDESEFDDFYSLELYISDFQSEKEMKKFIKRTEVLVRRSIEYQTWRKFILEVLGDNYCLFTHEINSEVTIELHHHPLTLYEITQIVINKYLMENKLFNSLMIATEILKLHYENKVGYIPLVKTLHEKYHNGFLEIPIEYIRGNYNKFLMEYNTYIDSDLKEKIKEKLEIKKDNSKDKNYIWIKEEGIK